MFTIYLDPRSHPYENGEAPLVTEHIIEKLYEKHVSKDAAISFVTAHNCDQSAAGYGRVIKANDSIEIIETKRISR